MSDTTQVNMAERVLSGEAPFETLQYPVTGDSELEFCTAVLILIGKLKLDPRQTLRCLAYLKERMEQRSDTQVPLQYAKTGMGQGKTLMQVLAEEEDQRRARDLAKKIATARDTVVWKPEA